MQSVAATAEGRSSGWLARSTIAGFVALAISTVVLVVAFAFAGAIGEIYRASGVPAVWMYGLTHNQIVEQGRGQVFGSLAVHLALGMFWAIVYGRIVAPWLGDWPTWQRGAVFALIPWALSITIIPLGLGAGLAYGDLGAGPLPVLGNLILHEIYGITLAAVYSAGADRADTRGVSQAEAAHQRLTLGRAETAAARGILLGGVLGAVAGIVLSYVLPFSSVEQLVASWPVAMAVTGALAGGAIGALVGSMVGLTDPSAAAIVTVEELPSEGEPIAAALIPLGVIVVVAGLIVSIGSALLTIGDTHTFGREQGYNQAIILGLSILTVVTFGAWVLSRGGQKPDNRH